LTLHELTGIITARFGVYVDIGTAQDKDFEYGKDNRPE
jgi:hypothetical protein